MPLKLRARDGVPPLVSSRAREVLTLEVTAQAQCAYESRGNRIRGGALEAGRHFFAPKGAALYGLMFALLYRNLMAACQIWCEHRPPCGGRLKSGASIARRPAMVG